MSGMKILFSRLLSVLWGRSHKILDNKIKRLKNLFFQIDKKIDSFKKETSLSCVKNCGYCCAHSGVEVSEAEMLPVADMLFHRGDIDEWYQKVSGDILPKQCVFYQPDQTNPNNGKCCAYSWRPLICRFFAFTGQKDKYGKLRLIVCGPMKQQKMDLVEKAQDDVAQYKITPVLMSDYFAKAALIDSHIGVELLPINLAFKKAVEHICLHRRYQMEQRQKALKE